MNPTPLLGKNALYLNALPYLNVLPLDDQKLDLWALGSLGSELPVQLIAKLLKQDSIEIGIDLTSHKKQSKEEQLIIKSIQESFFSFTKSSAPISIGYPLLILEDVALGRSITAPLFIWELDLRPADDGKSAHWILNYDSSQVLKYNEILKNYLITRFDLDWEELMGDPSKLKARQLLSALNRLASAIQINKPEIPKLFPCPSESYPTQMTNGILWAGMIGRIEPGKEDLDDLPLTLQPRSRRTWFTQISSLSLNSTQEAATDAFFNGEDILLKGAENSGKTRTITSLLSAILADHGSALYISKDTKTLHQLAHLLKLAGLGELDILVLEDENLDKTNFLNQLAQLPATAKKIPKLDEQRYSLRLFQYQQWRTQLSNAYHAMQQQVLGQQDWTNAVGDFMHNHRIDGKQFLSRLLDSTDFDWTEEEYRYLLLQIEENEPLFNQVHSLHHPLTALQDDIFLKLDEVEAYKKVSGQIKLNTRLLRDLYRNYTTFIDEYADDLRFHYEQHIKELKQRIEAILRNLKVYQEVYGNSFDFIDSFSNTRLRILSVFSKKHQQILAAKEQIYSAYDELKDFYASKCYFDYTLPMIRQHINLSDIAKDLTAFEQAADEWSPKIPKIVRQKVKELNQKIPLKPNQKRKLDELESQIEAYLAQLYNQHLLEKDVKIKAYKSIEREAYLRDLLERLTEIEDNMPLFSHFYKWRHHWLLMEAKCRKIITALVAVRPSSWITALKSWYLYHYLDKKYQLALPDKELPIADFLAADKELKDTLASNSLLTTRDRQTEQLRLLRKEKGINLAQSKTKFHTLSVSEIIETIGLETLTELFPIIFASPTMASKIFPYKVPLFDTVILEDAQSVELKLGRNLLRLGAQKIVSGNSNVSVKTNTIFTEVQGNKSFKHFELTGSYSPDSKVIAAHQAKAINLPIQFRQALFEFISDYIRPERLEMGVQLANGYEIDLVIKSASPNEAPIALIIDGWLKSLGQFEYEKALKKAAAIQKAGYTIYPIWSLDWWKTPDKSIQHLIAFVLK